MFYKLASDFVPSSSNITNLLRSASESDFAHCVQYPHLNRPDSPSCFVHFQPVDNSTNYKFDKYWWRFLKVCTNKSYTREYWYIQTKNDKGQTVYSNAFKRTVSFVSLLKGSVVFIQYSGDNTQFVDIPHSNAINKTTFIQTSDETKNHIKAFCRKAFSVKETVVELRADCLEIKTHS